MEEQGSAQRASALGEFGNFSEELLVELLVKLEDVKTLGILSCCSKQFRFHCLEEALWQSRFFRDFQGTFQYFSNWRTTYFKNVLHLPNAPQVNFSPNFFPRTNLYRSQSHGRWQRSGMNISQFLPPQESIPRIQNSEITDLTKFCEQFDGGNTPVVITNATTSWKLSEFDLFDLSQICGENEFPVQSPLGCSLYMRMRDYISYMTSQRDEEPLYIFNDDFVENVRELAECYNVPKVFSDDLFSLLGDEVRPDYRWFVVGPERSGARWHVDPTCTSAWNALTMGRKRWALYPPEHAPPGVEIEIDEDSGEVDFESPSSLRWFLEIYPNLTAEQKPLEIVQKPGEIIFVPGGWWHCVLNLQITLAITQNFVSWFNFHRVVQYMSRGGGQFILDQIQYWQQQEINQIQLQQVKQNQQQQCVNPMKQEDSQKNLEKFEKILSDNQQLQQKQQLKLQDDQQQQHQQLLNFCQIQQNEGRKLQPINLIQQNEINKQQINNQILEGYGRAAELGDWFRKLTQNFPEKRQIVRHSAEKWAKQQNWTELLNSIIQKAEFSQFFSPDFVSKSVGLHGSDFPIKGKVFQVASKTIKLFLDENVLQSQLNFLLEYLTLKSLQNVENRCLLENVKYSKIENAGNVSSTFNDVENIKLNCDQIPYLVVDTVLGENIVSFFNQKNQIPAEQLDLICFRFGQIVRKLHKAQITDFRDFVEQNIIQSNQKNCDPPFSVDSRWNQLDFFNQLIEQCFDKKKNASQEQFLQNNEQQQNQIEIFFQQGEQNQKLNQQLFSKFQQHQQEIQIENLQFTLQQQQQQQVCCTNQQYTDLQHQKQSKLQQEQNQSCNQQESQIKKNQQQTNLQQNPNQQHTNLQREKESQQQQEKNQSCNQQENQIKIQQQIQQQTENLFSKQNQNQQNQQDQQQKVSYWKNNDGDFWCNEIGHVKILKKDDQIQIFEDIVQRLRYGNWYPFISYLRWLRTTVIQRHKSYKVLSPVLIQQLEIYLPQDPIILLYIQNREICNIPCLCHADLTYRNVLVNDVVQKQQQFLLQVAEKQNQHATQQQFSLAGKKQLQQFSIVSEKQVDQNQQATQQQFTQVSEKQTDQNQHVTQQQFSEKQLDQNQTTTKQQQQQQQQLEISTSQLQDSQKQTHPNFQLKQQLDKLQRQNNLQQEQDQKTQKESTPKQLLQDQKEAQFEVGVIDFGDSGVGDFLYDFVAVFVSSLQAQQSWFEHFLRGYGFDRAQNRGERLSYICMCYSILHEECVLGRAMKLRKELREMDSLQQMQKQLWGFLDEK